MHHLLIVKMAKKVAKKQLPSPFEPAPENVIPLLNKLARDRVYLSHIDPHPAVFKRQIFTVPVILNLAFIAVLAWRFYYISPWYLSCIESILELGKSTVAQVYGDSLIEIIKREARHFITVMIDYVLFAFVAPWPYTFFFARSGNPTMWRIKIGFQAREAVFRQSRSWGAEDLLNGSKKGDDSPFWKTKILPGVELDKIGKTGYLLMDADWDLEFNAMVLAHDALDVSIKEKDLNGKLWAWWQSGDQDGEWLMWNFREALYDGSQPGSAIATTTGSDKYGDDVDVDEGRRMIFRFKDKLAEMNKEELFYKWVELIQYESTRPGGFTSERQIEAGAKVKALFDQYHVDFEEFEKQVGIKDGRLAES